MLYRDTSAIDAVNNGTNAPAWVFIGGRRVAKFGWKSTAASLARMLRSAGLDDKQLALAGAYISGMLRSAKSEEARDQDKRNRDTAAKIMEALGYDLDDIEHAHCCH